ncbi:lysozyme inhibitor LprI family protein [Paraburkholderia susongensis]|uniref:lysozyme inhibitor LprI family protein n=1 Tax=Paraburkholderia susongensis TaxID=1515439 RepID=UPI000A1CBB05|nr:lysozyme inhibitor LprI family protein [Paraburkholderia susongensis]
MMRAISIGAMLIFASLVFGQSIYSGPFDYTKVKPAEIFFSGKSPLDIKVHCKTDSLSTEEAWQCSHFQFEQASVALNRQVAVIAAELKKNDRDLKAGGYPLALPFFKKAQEYWKSFRDNECYSDTYSLGQASMRDMVFWDCMTRITTNRLDELKKPNDD